jgi:outer membrane receptor protein involved in Fe transport
LPTALINATCDLDDDGLLDGTDVSSNLTGVDSDSLESYEVGAKLTMIDGRATLNAAIYRNNWENIPVSFQPPGCLENTTINGGTAKAEGVEFEGNLVVTDALKMNIALSYVETKLTSGTSAGNSGDRMNFTPKINGSFGVSYDFDIAGNGAFIRTDYTYFGNYYTGTGETGIKLDSYSLVNASAGINLDEIDHRLYVNNVTNGDDYTSREGFPTGYAIRLRPRTIGFNVAYNF